MMLLKLSTNRKHGIPSVIWLSWCSLCTKK